jgi:plasmid maintenance system killer protein
VLFRSLLMVIDDRWRVCFVWSGGHAQDVEIVDYH